MQYYFSRLLIPLTTEAYLVLGACSATVTPSLPPTASPTLTPSSTIPPTVIPIATIAPTPTPTTSAISSPDSPSNELAIINGMIIDGTGADPIPDGIVLIERDRIVRVGSMIEIPIPSELAG